MYDTMKSLCGEDVFVSIYHDTEDTDKFGFGRLLCVNETRYALLSLTPFGDYDGVVVRDTEDVFRIATCGQYHEKMKKLLRVNWDAIDLPDLDSSRIDFSVLSFAKERGKIVSVGLEEGGVFDVAGLVEDVSETVCKIRVINEYGYDDGVSYIDMDSIPVIQFDSDEEERIARLYRANAQNT